ncbi:VOC family protein [Chondrinema litorale]|uniref:VOC family protein n=1 Tax=Chondrinema litorale TaxID=2994555 RepID=UPI0025426EFF|nr:hypothetical protein [Chondrinema litorale]UZR95230.1 hypothetical protein OQ292_05280 [Chondrinema litorale]
MKKTTLRGVATISFWAEDVEAAKKWYAEFLDVEPYFQREYNGKLAYVEFRLGDYQQELGIISSQFKPKWLVQP